MEILFQNEQFVVCIKPAGVPSQQAPGAARTMLTLLEEELGGSFYPVHRLDKPVGGVMVYARTEKTAAFFSRAMQNGTFHKEYLAVLRGIPQEPAGRLEDLLYHDPRRNKTYVVKKKRKGVREAALEYEQLAERESEALVRVRLLTGRTHQIRAQFASRGLPLCGDGPYGGGSGPTGLWSAKLTFPDPDGGERSFTHLPPEAEPWAPFFPLSL